VVEGRASSSLLQKHTSLAVVTMLVKLARVVASLEGYFLAAPLSFAPLADPGLRRGPPLVATPVVESSSTR
jgi:hypothetical protein